MLKLPSDSEPPSESAPAKGRSNMPVKSRHSIEDETTSGTDFLYRHVTFSYVVQMSNVFLVA